MAVLDSQFPAEAVYPGKLWHQLVLHSQAGLDLSQYQMFRGHFYAFLEQFLGCPLRTFTFLRDPLERALSHYAHVKREPHHYLHSRALELGTLEAFILDPDTRPMIYNFQTRSLAMRFDVRRLASQMAETDIRGLKLERAIETWMPAAPEENALLAQASAELDHMVAVGLTSRYAESVGILDQKMGWSLSEATQPRLNVSPERDSVAALSPGERLLLERANRLDDELWRRATRRFEEDLARLG